MKKPALSDLIAAVRAVGADVGHPGEGWYSTGEVAAQMGMSIGSANQRLAALARAGKADKCLRSGGTGGVKAYWRLK